MNVTRVLLGPPIDLHPGVHNPLLEHPTPGIKYSTSAAEHVFLFPAGGASPYRTFHWGELVRFPAPQGEFGAGVAHSPRWPVLGRRGWVTDTDDFGFPVLCGRYGLNEAFRTAFRDPWTPALERDIRRRAENMLTGYAHASCKGVLFRSRAAVADAERWVSRLALGDLGERFLAKIRLVYPAQRALDPARVTEKWTGAHPLRLIFCGREYESKNGALALRVFGRLLSDFPQLECVYIGKIPDAERQKHRAALEKIRYFDSLTRADVLERFANSHVLFHPSEFESVGMVFVEAAAAGMAVVAATGGAMSDNLELFGDGGALLVNRHEVPKGREEAAFEERLRSLMARPAEAREMGLRNHSLTRDGDYSVDRRDTILRQVYEEAEHNPAGEPLRLDHLPHVDQDGVVEMESAMVRADERSWRAEAGVTQQRFLI